MRPEQRTALTARLDAVAPQARDPAMLALIGVVQAIIDAMPDAKQPKLKPKGARRGT